MQRIFIEDQVLGEEKLVLSNADIVFQLSKVLRSKAGDEVVFFDGKESVDYKYEITNIGKKEIEFKYIEKIENISENEYDINLYQALPNKLSKLEYILQKGVETGLSNFIFFRSDRSQKLVLSENKIERLKKILTEAVEQSGRNKVPQIRVMNNSFIELLNGLQSLSMMKYNGSENEQNLFFHTNDENSLKLNSVDHNVSTNMFVGPEGGWSDEEVSKIKEMGFKQIHLGNRVLRCETVSSVVGFYLGE